MNSRTTRSTNRPMLWAVVILSMVTAEPSARAPDGIYTITWAWALFRANRHPSVATSINNSGQVVGISYNSSDGAFTQVLTGSGGAAAASPRQGAAQAILSIQQRSDKPDQSNRWFGHVDQRLRASRWRAVLVN